MLEEIGRRAVFFFAIIITITALNYSPKPLSIFIISLSLFFIGRFIWKWDRHDKWLKWAKEQGWQENDRVGESPKGPDG